MSFLEQLMSVFVGGSGLIAPEEAQRLVAAGGQLVDVRTASEWSAGHLPGAIHIPLAELGARASELDPSRAVILYCRSGARSGRAQGRLQGAGFTDVHNLGPMSAWPDQARTQFAAKEEAVEIEVFFDESTNTFSYVVYDLATRDAVIIDPVLDFDPLRVSVAETGIEKILAFVRGRDLRVHYVLDTHVHADHLSGFQRLRAELGAKIGIGSHVREVQEVFAAIFNWGAEFTPDGSQFDVLVEDGVALHAGSLTIEPMHTPGHTPACMSYRIGDALFVGDTMFMPDFGTGRCDFPGGSAEQLYDSIQKLYALPESTRVFVGHDYCPGGRELRWETTIGECKRDNKQLRADTSREEFVAWRTQRDATLSPPRLIFQSLQVNAKAGVLPEPDTNGKRYLCMPMGVFG